eukprot:CAMPEP_0194235660 /NCGR_PEP_ID=MMETSP0158-20130606/3093_1 /TAXON_ID=33649 /ORGANISM="Thalassionema nitzschioides, Strain L26-B" /LENGTH=151 /DNA_ID=CAMNT_0038969185 /DNA_START=7 /DNA_END=462 /DNA_ORIENTATION=-
MSQKAPKNYSSRARTPPSTSIAPSGVPYGYVPAYLPGSASLVEELDKQLMIVLRDGRHLVGKLRSFDQFSNMVMEDASERHMCCKDGVSYYCDVPLGLYVVRGDSMVLLGQVGDILNTDRIKKVDKEVLDKMLEESGSGELNWDFDTDLTA